MKENWCGTLKALMVRVHCMGGFPTIMHARLTSFVPEFAGVLEARNTSHTPLRMNTSYQHQTRTLVNIAI